VPMKWCCPGFEWHYSNAANRGVAILVGSDSRGEPAFTLQYRAVEKGSEELVSSANPISLVIDVGMQYCPWCGKHLATCYGKYVNELYRPSLKIDYT
jgi:hypothetical protein